MVFLPLASDRVPRRRRTRVAVGLLATFLSYASGVLAREGTVVQAVLAVVFFIGSGYLRVGQDERDVIRGRGLRMCRLSAETRHPHSGLVERLSSVGR